MRNLVVLALALTPLLALAEKEKSKNSGEDLHTNVFTVRPNFFEKLEEINPATPPVIAPPVIAIKAFEDQGITFPEGSTAVYNPATSQLIVRNTKDQMDLVETLVDHVNGIVDKQIYITVKEVTVSGDAAEKVGFDWMLIPSAPAPATNTFSAKGIVTDSKESFLEEFSRPPTVEKKQNRNRPAPSSGIAAVFTDPQFQVVIRALNQTKGVDLLSAPSVMTRSNQPGLIQVDEKRWGIIPVIGSDGFTIDLELYLPGHGEALYKKGEKPSPTTRVTIWDGQTVAWSEKIDDDTYRTAFIRAQLMDPTGMPINKKPENLPAPAADDTVEGLQGSNEEYEVEKGDTLHSIALKCGVSTDQLADANFLSSNVLQIGQKLVIPEP